MLPSDVPSSADTPPFGGIGKFGPQSGAPSYPKFEAPASTQPVQQTDETVSDEPQGTDVIGRGLRFYDILSGKKSDSDAA
jgi:hypothetical protein